MNFEEEQKMENKDIRRMAAGSGVRLWQVAAEIGMNDSAFSRKLRRELKPAEKDDVTPKTGFL